MVRARLVLAGVFNWRDVVVWRYGGPAPGAANAAARPANFSNSGINARRFISSTNRSSSVGRAPAPFPDRAVLLMAVTTSAMLAVTTVTRSSREGVAVAACGVDLGESAGAPFVSTACAASPDSPSTAASCSLSRPRSWASPRSPEVNEPPHALTCGFFGELLGVKRL